MRIMYTRKQLLRRQRNVAVLVMLAEGVSLRRIAEASGLSHTQVRRIRDGLRPTSPTPDRSAGKPAGSTANNSPDFYRWN